VIAGNIGSSQTIDITGNDVAVSPITITSGTSEQISDIMFNLPTPVPGGQQVIIGIYADTGANHPAGLIYSSGVTSCEAGVNDIVPSPRVYLTSGTYWVALCPITSDVFIKAGAASTGKTLAFTASSTTIPPVLTSTSPLTAGLTYSMAAWFDYCP
jgi:hypothetical protein